MTRNLKGYGCGAWVKGWCLVKGRGLGLLGIAWDWGEEIGSWTCLGGVLCGGLGCGWRDAGIIGMRVLFPLVVGFGRGVGLELDWRYYV